MRVLTTTLVLLAALWGLPGASEELVSRTVLELCEELQYELRSQIDSGMITERDAVLTTIRCYDLFLND